MQAWLVKKPWLFCPQSNTFQNQLEHLARSSWSSTDRSIQSTSLYVRDSKSIQGSFYFVFFATTSSMSDTSAVAVDESFDAAGLTTPPVPFWGCLIVNRLTSSLSQSCVVAVRIQKIIDKRLRISNPRIHFVLSTASPSSPSSLADAPFITRR
mmetsp:Transcript_37923/g.92288  ORF Transcript_37923/g.92288 Transcript_37923/m.92288 type:complete len:153 (+) Transcript_37923:114-572(+)